MLYHRGADRLKTHAHMGVYRHRPWFGSAPTARNVTIWCDDNFSFRAKGARLALVFATIRARIARCAELTTRDVAVENV